MLDIELKETTAALAWATRLNDQWSAGLAAMVLFRNHRYRENFSATLIADPAFNPVVDVVSSESDISLKTNITLLQLRGSLAWKNGPWSAGLVVTLPSLRVLTSGDMIAEISLNNIRPDSLSERQSYFASAFLDKRKPVFKYPVSVSAGVSRQLGEKVQVSVAATWYGALERYVVIDPGDTPFLQPPSEENIIYTNRFLEVWSSNRSLVNTFASAEWAFNQRVSLLTGFRTDLHYGQFLEPTPAGFQLPKKIWNRYHFNLGASISGKRSKWIMGVQYSRGHADDYRQPYSFDGVTESNFLQGQKGRGTIQQNGLTGTLSFFFFINKDQQNRPSNK